MVGLAWGILFTLKLKHCEMDDLEKKEALQKQLMQVICICKGIPLARVLKGLENSETVYDVNLKTGCGSGGCKGERCGPRIKILLAKKREADEKKKQVDK